MFFFWPLVDVACASLYKMPKISFSQFKLKDRTPLWSTKIKSETLSHSVYLTWVWVECSQNIITKLKFMQLMLHWIWNEKLVGLFIRQKLCKSLKFTCLVCKDQWHILKKVNFSVQRLNLLWNWVEAKCNGKTIFLKVLREKTVP